MSQPPDPIRVLLVDDSAVVRGALGRIIDAEGDMRVVTTAPNGQVALDALKHTPIDVVLLDIEMPVMDGLTALPLILAQYPATRVIMASSLTQRGAEISFQAMALGAADFIAKPAARTGAAALASIAQEIAMKVRAIGRARGRSAAHSANSGSVVADRPFTGLLASRGPVASVRVVAIAASTGGPNALAEVLSALPADFPIPILITQHMPALFTAMLAQRLERDGKRPCTEARDGEVIRANHTYVAPGGFHMIVQTNEGQPYLRLTQSEPENYCRPAADPMFRSVASIYGSSSLAVVLTGMGDDGVRGCRDIHARGGRIVVQDEASSVVWGMPGAVAGAGIAASIAPLSDIASTILSSCAVTTFMSPAGMVSS